MVTDYEAAWVALQAEVASKPQHGQRELLKRMAELAGEHRVVAGELPRVLRLYGVEVAHAVLGGNQGDREGLAPGGTSDAALPGDPAFRAWLAGFLDGEGCFIIAAHTGGRQGPTYGCEVRIRLRADDTPVLERIVQELGIGNVRQEPAGEVGHPKALWRVGSKEGCALMVRILDRHPLVAKKARDYAIWREAVHEWCSENRPRGAAAASDWTQMIALRERLKAVRQYRDEGVSPDRGFSPAPEDNSPTTMTGGHDGSRTDTRSRAGVGG